MCDLIFISLLLTVILITYYRLNIKHKSIYREGYIKISGTVISNTSNIIIRSREKILVNNSNISLELGDYIEIEGYINKAVGNYQKYLNKNNIYNIINSKKIKIIKHNNNNIYYFIKNKINKRINNNPYLSTFILGDKFLIDKEVKNSYQANGISHLFALSGMHITLFSSIIEKLLRKILDEYDSFKITCLVLLFYLLLIGLYPSIVRGVLFYILFSINRIYYFYVRGENIFILILSIALLINPKYIYDIAFWYSYLISFSLIRFSKYLNGNYIYSLFKVSILSFIVSIPITIYNYYEINTLGILYNIFYVPFISFIIFPFTLIVFIFKFLEPVYNCLIVILESTSLFLSSIDIGKIVFRKVFVGVYVIYIILVLLYLIFNKRIFMLFYFLLLVIHLLIPFFDRNSYVNYIDVGQGDSILIELNKNNILIDTGCDYSKLNRYLKSRGYKKIDYLIISHGDYDHMGEAINLVNNFKVEKVIFNCGSYNDLEKDLIKVLDKKKIKYYYCIKELNIDNNKLYFLQTKEYGNENDNSNVIYMKLNKYKFLFMGDAGIEKEKDILDKYNISDIDVLKVGHHGSMTSSSKIFIDVINPKYSIISVGENNRYGHPNKEVLEYLEESKIYRTDEDGTVMFKIKNNKLKIVTCSS